MGYKISADRYVEICFKTMKRKTKYRNSPPWNCGYYDGTYLYGDCWCFNPKVILWSESIGQPVCDNYTVGKYYYTEGINASGMPDVTGDVIMSKYCTQTTFKKMLTAGVAPCLLLINGQHMGSYIGEFTYNGKTYNACEFTPNANLGDGLCPSYVDENGGRRTCKGGKLLGYWDKCGYLTSFVDYTKASSTTIKDNIVKLDTEELAKAIISGTVHGREIGNGEERKTALRFMGYTDEEISAAQKRVNEMLAPEQTKKLSTEELAQAIIAGEVDGKKIGNGAERKKNLKALGYTDDEISAAQKRVNELLEGGASDPKEGQPLTKAQADAMFNTMTTPTPSVVWKYAKSLGFGENAYAALLGWVQGEGYWGVNDPYLGYLSACVMINNIAEGAYGKTGTEILNKIASWGSYYTVAKQKERAKKASSGALRATYMALKHLQTGIHCCYGPGTKPKNVFYDPQFKVDGKNIYVF